MRLETALRVHRPGLPGLGKGPRPLTPSLSEPQLESLEKGHTDQCPAHLQGKKHSGQGQTSRNCYMLPKCEE